jgi:hypothetical protein
MVGVRLRGSREDLEEALESVAREREVELVPWRHDGGWPVPLAEIASDEILARYADLGPRIKKLKGIHGGEVVPHFHLGDEVVLLEPEEFKKLVGEVAMRLATELAGRVDYEKTVSIMSRFAIDTVPLPE